MNRTTALLSALLVTGAWVIASCGGKVVVDGTADATASSAGGAGGGGSGTGSSSGGSTGSGGCDDATHTIDLTDFNLSCTVASDCIAVFAGSFCSSCQCPFSAINVADAMKFEAEKQIKDVGGAPGGCFCPASEPICAQGQCMTKVP